MTIGMDSDSFVILLENFGNHEISDVFSLAVQNIKGKVKKVQEELKQL